jgi:hypothetical protein
MRFRRPIQVGVLLIPLALTSAMALAQGQGQQAPTADHSAHHDQTGQQTEQPAMGGGPMTGGMMGPGMMQGGVGHGMMQGGMGPGMMQGGMGPGMMQGGSMGPGMMQGGMGALFGSRVTPMMNLSVDDVRGYLAVQLDHLNNKRLKIGDIKSDDGAITADIVTIDNSLVQRLKVDRHTGAIEYQN